MAGGSKKGGTKKASPNTGKKKAGKESTELRSAEEIYKALVATPKLVVISAAEAAEIFRIFRGVKIDSSMTQKFEHRAFLQAAMMSAVDGSFAMSWIESLLKSALKPTATVTGIIGKLAATGLKHLFRKWKGEEQKLYTSVVSTISYSHRPYFDMIGQGIDD